MLRTLCDDAAAGAPGEILSTKPLKVACASGALTLLEVVPEGSRPMEGSAWAAGRRFTMVTNCNNFLLLPYKSKKEKEYARGKA